VDSDRPHLALVPLIRHVIAPGRWAHRQYFEIAPPAPGMVVFLGDSLTHRGLWDAYLPEPAGIDWGIDGDTTEDVIDSLDSAVVEPGAVSLLIGTNDLHATAGCATSGGSPPGRAGCGAHPRDGAGCSCAAQQRAGEDSATRADDPRAERPVPPDRRGDRVHLRRPVAGVRVE
jgi:hypothetical protein